MTTTRDKLLKYQDLKYRDFTYSLTIKNIDIIGIRIPILRKISNQFTLDELSNNTLEELLLQAMIIGKYKDIEKVLEYIDIYVPKINCWNVCDNFCGCLKITKKYKDKALNHILKYKNGTEYERRFLIVMLLSYFIEDKYINLIKNIIYSIKKDEYYVMMAVAWLISYIAVYSKEDTVEIIKNIDNKVLRNKSISKITDSFRISDIDKKYYRELRL